MHGNLNIMERDSVLISTTHLARLVLIAFLLTFMCARMIVFLIMSRSIPDLYLHVKGTHVHHLNYGIFLLSGIGGYLVFRRPTGRILQVAALLYGIGTGSLSTSLACGFTWAAATGNAQAGMRSRSWRRF